MTMIRSWPDGLSQNGVERSGDPGAAVVGGDDDTDGGRHTTVISEGKATAGPKRSPEQRETRAAWLIEPPTGAVNRVIHTGNYGLGRRRLARVTFDVVPIEDIFQVVQERLTPRP